MKKYFIAATVFCIALVGFISFLSSSGGKVALAATPYLSGWAWSSNIGFISFNNSNSGGASCTVYCVTYDTTANTLSGYAWSSSIGWIQFGGLGTAPDGGSSDAVVQTATGKVLGWARACMGTTSRTCGAASRTDGWDGWIDLRGTAQNASIYGVNYDSSTGVFNGFAWGGDVVGWVNFNVGLSQTGQTIPGVNCTGSCGGGTGNTPLSSNCSASYVTYSDGTYLGVRFTANPSGGTAPYTYIWKTAGITDASKTGSTANYFYPPAKDYTSETSEVTDASGANVFSSCAGVNVTASPAGNPSTVLLQIGPNGGAASTHLVGNPLIVKAGSLFKLAWTNTLTAFNGGTGAGYRCSAQLPPNSSTSNWAGLFNDSAVSSTGSVSGLNTDQVTTGTYTFNIECKQSLPALDTKEAPAVLKITSVNEGEI